MSMDEQAERKAGVSRLIEPQALPGSGGIVTMALIELGIERHLRTSSSEKGAPDLLDGLLRKVIARR